MFALALRDVRVSWELAINRCKTVLNAGEGRVRVHFSKAQSQLIVKTQNSGRNKAFSAKHKLLSSIGGIHGFAAKSTAIFERT